MEATPREAIDPTLALQRAIASRKNTSTVQALLEQGADPNCKDSSGYSVLGTAVTNKSLKIVQLMLEHGADLHVHHRSNPHLYEACRFSAPKMVDLLLQHGADPNARARSMMPLRYPIEIAIYVQQPKIVQSLLVHGAKVCGVPGMGNLLEINVAGLGHEFFRRSGELDKVCAIFKLLIAHEPTYQAILAQQRARLVGLMTRGFPKMQRDASRSEAAKNQKDFEALLDFIKCSEKPRHSCREG